MTLLFWRGRGPTALSPKLRNAVIDRFNLTEKAIDALKMIQKNGRFAGRKVTHIRVFDPSIVSGEVTRYGHLDGLKQSIRFTGRIEQGGTLYLDYAVNA